MRKVFLYLLMFLWLVPLCLAVLILDGPKVARSVWHSFRLVVVFGFFALAGTAQNPTLLEPGDNLNRLTYSGTGDTLWGFAIVIVEFRPEVMLGDTTRLGRRDYALQPVPAYCIGYERGLSNAQFFSRHDGRKIGVEWVVWFKIVMPK